MLTSLLVYGGFVPLMGATAAALICRLFGVSPRATWAWSVTSGLLSAQIGGKSRAGFAMTLRAFTKPAEAADWLPIILALVLGISLLLFVAPRARPWILIVLAAVFCIAVPLRLLSGNVQVEDWSAVNKLAYLAVLAAAFGLSWALLASKGDERTCIGRVLAVMAVAAAEAVVLTQSGVLVYGLACGAVAASVGVVALVDLVLGEAAVTGRRLAFSGFPGAAGVITFSLVSLNVLGLFFASLTTMNAVLLLAALLTAGAPLPRGIAGQPLWLQLSIRALLCGIPLVVAVVGVIPAQAGI